MTLSGEQLMQVLRQRRSVRQFTSQPVAEELLVALVEAAIQAPSASNRQDWQYTVVTNAAIIKELSAQVATHWSRLCDTVGTEEVKEQIGRYAENFSWFSAAPAIIIVSCKRPEAFLQEMLGQDTWAVAGAYASAAMSVQNMLLAAEVLGLGTCCLTGPLAAAQEIKTTLGLGDNRRLVCLVAVGYAVAPAAAQPRKTLSRVMRIVK